MSAIAETERLKIEQFTIDDAPFILELFNTENWLTYIGDRHIRSIEDAENYLKNSHFKSYETLGYGFYKVLLKSENHRIIGTCGFAKRPELEDVDLGFGFLPSYEGKGFGFESSMALLQLAKKQFNLERIIAITLSQNTSSIRLIKKLGMKFEKNVIPFEDGEELLLFAKAF